MNFNVGKRKIKFDHGQVFDYDSKTRIMNLKCGKSDISAQYPDHIEEMIYKKGDFVCLLYEVMGFNKPPLIIKIW